MTSGSLKNVAECDTDQQNNKKRMNEGVLCFIRKVNVGVLGTLSCFPSQS